MPTRYEYDLDGNSQWRWIAIAADGATLGVSSVGYSSLQDCMHAVGLMRAPATVVPTRVAPPPTPSAPPPEMSLSRLHRQP